MNSVPYQNHRPVLQPPLWNPIVPPNPPQSSSFWDSANVCDRLKELNETVDLANAMQKELEMLSRFQDSNGSIDYNDDDDVGCRDGSFDRFFNYLDSNKIDFEEQEMLSVKAANALIAKLRYQLEPFRVATDETSPWEERFVAVRLANKREKAKRNKEWRKRKRKSIAEMHAKERGRFDQADQEADEWRAREIAKDIAKSKVDKMKEISKLKAKEERNRLESELEQVLIVEKLKELRSIRIEKLKKQGHFLPEEDDKFLERVRAAVEEEERLVMAAADSETAKGAIATAEESRKVLPSHGYDAKNQTNKDDDRVVKESKYQINEHDLKKDLKAVAAKEAGKQGSDGQGHGGHDFLASLPAEFYHYYHGSNRGMGTLIEVRRSWDAYIRPGGSRIPGHWIAPSPPSDQIWASYLVKPKLYLRQRKLKSLCYLKISHVYKVLNSPT